MDEILALSQIDFAAIFVGVIVILIAIKFIVTLFEWFVNKLGLETKWMRKKRENEEQIKRDRELLIKTTETANKLQERHEDDTDKILAFMDRMEKQMAQYSDNRINDRQVSIDRETRLNDRINCLQESDNVRDEKIEAISANLEKLTGMFIDKQISDYRWEIINFATAISEKKPCTKDGYKHCFATYEKYEKILEENQMENGEVEISMEIIRDGYKEKLKEGF